jgi:hypothetical protein
VAEDAEFSLSVSRNKQITAAIGAIDETAYTPVRYPGAVQDPDTGQLISDAQVAETPYTLRLSRGRTLRVRLVVRRVKPNLAPPDPTNQTPSTRHPRPNPSNLVTRKCWYSPADRACATSPHPAAIQSNHVGDHTKSPIHGFRPRSAG